MRISRGSSASIKLQPFMATHLPQHSSLFLLAPRMKHNSNKGQKQKPRDLNLGPNLAGSSLDGVTGRGAGDIGDGRGVCSDLCQKREHGPERRSPLQVTVGLFPTSLLLPCPHLEPAKCSHTSWGSLPHLLRSLLLSTCVQRTKLKASGQGGHWRCLVGGGGE